MKTLLKRVLFSTLGPATTAKLVRTIRSRPEAFYESEMVLRWFDANPRNGVMADVGAHFGESLSPYLARGWRIHAFEPDPVNRGRLKAEVDVNKIILHEIAVSDHEGENVPFFASPESDGISSLSAFRETHREVNRVRLTTLAKILEEQTETRVDFLKVDTEGHDLFVLKGFPWSRFKPDVVLSEFEDSKSVPLGWNYRDMGDYLIAKGYQVYLSEWEPIVRYGGNHKWRRCVPYPCTLEDTKGWGNFIAIRTGLDLAPIKDYLSRFERSNS